MPGGSGASGQEGGASEVLVRAAVLAEVAEVLAFWRRAAEGVSVSDDVAGVRGLLERDPEALLSAWIGGRLVGTVIAGFDGWRCHLYRLAVAPEYRRRGVATALLAAAERRFEALGGRRADAMVLHRNELARHAWASAGYRRQPEWGRWVKPLPR
ncbi:GNAT family N-acetyltransferase [Streptomyces hoynatensis]|uniref:GNAT family N-acetyltransferase n=1 Tax=Streptomyces hoynatensis TaxID=1141874 RepID=A0A3A9YT04_9ACTN|nr:GNAT family N-acetyltransferase [Streptomyces hoynatensis]RKN39168.1 GNAT family N-acetyltransferase [Streptomyces hoynatensis]